MFPIEIFSITCVSARNCYALGFSRGTADAALIQHWNGVRWSAMATPRPAGAADSYLYNASCLTAADCWAAGMYTIGRGHYTLIERWNGTAWAIVPSPTPAGTSYNALGGVACTTAASCVAVGFTEKTGVNSILTEHWDGVKWSVVPVPSNA